MTIHRVIEYLNNDSLFAELHREDYFKVAQQFRQADFRRNQVIFQEGEPGDKIYFLVKGEACVLKKMGGGERKLKLLQPGECFGEMALISQDKRSATVKAITDAQCLVMTSADFFQLIDEDKQFGRRMMRILSSRLTHAEERANIQYYEFSPIIHPGFQFPNRYPGNRLLYRAVLGDDILFNQLRSRTAGGSCRTTEAEHNKHGKQYRHSVFHNVSLGV